MRPLDTAVVEKNINVLIIDKIGTIGEALSQIFSEQASTVFVSKAKPPADSSIIHIPFTETIPAIPDGFYSAMVYVYSKEDKDLLEPLSQKAQQDKVNFFIVVQYEQMPLLSEYLSSKQTYGHLVVLGDLFGYGKGEMDRWLADIKKSKKAVLFSMGLNSWYPIFFEDAIGALITVCTMAHLEDKQVYLLAPTHPVTQLTITHALQKIDPLTKIDFSEEGEQSVSCLPKGKHMVEEYKAVEKITGYYQNLTITESAANASFPLFSTPARSVVKRKKQGNLGFFVVYTLIIFVCMPFLVLLLTGFIGRWLLLSGIEDIKHGSFQTAQQKIEAAATNIFLAQFSSQLVEKEVSIFGLDQQLLPIRSQLTLASTIANTLKEGVVAGTKIQSVITGKSLKPIEDTIDGVNSLKATLIALQKLQTEDIPKEYQDKLEFVNSSYTETIADALPQLIGAGGERKYLVLFQNNTELRPGGGFIGSYGVLRLSHGKFKDFTIHDVYEADGQLKGHVEPPFAIRRYMPLVHLYLRDSNFDVDFAKNAEKAAFMLKAETGDQVDGVVATDLSFVKSIIDAMGSIYVPSYNQIVTKDNFFLLTEEHAEKNSFPGSTQKKDFLSSLFSAMQDKLHSKSGISSEKLLASAFKGLDEKHVLLASEDQGIQASFSVNGLSSALLDTRVKEEGVLYDFLGISEANIGVNKVNYYIKRNVSHNVLVTDKGAVKESVMLTYTNSSDGRWPGGTYRNYLRFILPNNTTLDSVSINGIDQKIIPAVIDPQFYEAPNFVAQKGLEVEQTEEGGKTLYAFLVTVPVKSSTQIGISYTLAGTVNTNEPLPTYSLQLFKQPGVDVVPYSLEVAFPRGFSLLKADQKVRETKSVVSLTQNIVKDTIVGISFVKK